MASDRNWSNVLAGASQLPKDWLDTAERWHRHFLLKAIPAILLTLVAGVGLNAAGWKEINFLFALSAILGGLFFATQPKVVLTVFGVGTLWNGLLDSQVKGAKANLDQGLQFVSDKYVRPVGHVLLLATVVFVFLGTYRIQNPLAMLPLIAVVMGLGLWAALFAADTTWYRRITLKILLAAGVMSLIGAYFYTPSRTEKTIEQIEKAQEANRERLIDEGLTPILRKAEHGVKLTERETEILQAAKAREESRSILTKVKSMMPHEKKSIPVTIKSLRDGQIVCSKNLTEGTWKWRFEKRDFPIQLQEIKQIYNMVGFLFINGSAENEEIEIRKGGCFTLNFPAFSKELQESSVIPNAGVLMFY